MQEFTVEEAPVCFDNLQVKLDRLEALHIEQMDLLEEIQDFLPQGFAIKQNQPL